MCLSHTKHCRLNSDVLFSPEFMMTRAEQECDSLACTPVTAGHKLYTMYSLAAALAEKVQ